ncbi:hypothetical protein K438DRAFT_1999531 [Mycena galopus ATCC 62051]|nr:hypothetical protein K438DRAFT_1999531 [Mycena galopus ATCC 62051]
MASRAFLSSSGSAALSSSAILSCHSFSSFRSASSRARASVDVSCPFPLFPDGGGGGVLSPLLLVVLADDMVYPKVASIISFQNSSFTPSRTCLPSFLLISTPNFHVEVIEMPATRKSSRKISTSIDIAKVATADDLDSADEMDIDPDATLLDEEPDEPWTLTFGDDPEEEEYADSEEGDEPGSEDEGLARKGNRPTPPQTINYKIVVYTPEQMRKPKNSRGLPVTNVFKLLSNKPWIVLHTHILEAFNNALDSAPFHFSDYSITFTIPCQVTDPIRLSETKYTYLLEKALSIKTNPSARILIEPKVDAVNKENGDDDVGSTGTTAKKGAKKTKVPKARDILPGNMALNDKIRELRERWNTDPDHSALSHAHIESWAAAMFKGKEFADIDTPHNNQLFDKVSAAARAARSPILQQRQLEIREQAAAAKNAVASPQFHFNIGPEVLTFLRPQAAPAMAIREAFILPPNTSNMLILPPRLPGLDVSIEDFYSQYDLDDEICMRFKEQKFKRTDAFQFVEVSELTEMGFCVAK